MDAAAACSHNTNKVATIDRGTGERRIWSEVADRVNGLSSGLLGLDLRDW